MINKHRSRCDLESRLKVKVVYEGEVLYTDMLTRNQMEKLIAGMKRKGYDLEVTRIGEDS